jgi:hypothetical protein
MLSFLHAQAVGTPLKQAVLGLDFFGFNIFFPRNQEQQEARFAGDGVKGFADFLNVQLQTRQPASLQTPSRNTPPDPSGFNEPLYLAVNLDVAAAVARKDFKSGREHYELAGRAERRKGATVPADWDETGYRQVHPDVGYAISQGHFLSGYHHYLAAGQAEGRLGGFQPADWNEAKYLDANPSARIRIALGDYRSGYVHYAAVGGGQGFLGGFPATDPLSHLRSRWPTLNKAIFQSRELGRMVFSTTVARDTIMTPFRQSESPTFNDAGMRVWAGQDKVLASTGGSGRLIRAMLTDWRWYLWLMPPRYMYCFTNADTGMTMLDPFRFMLRRAYEEQTDLRMYVTPLHASARTLLVDLGLGERYEFWMKEIVRINDEESARAGRKPLPLWDFGNPNTITREPIPAPNDATPMRSYWEFSHYRKAAGDLILDRILDHREPGRTLPADFGVQLTGTNIDAHLARSKSDLAEWATANSDLATQIAQAVANPKVQNNQAKATCW